MVHTDIKLDEDKKSEVNDHDLKIFGSADDKNNESSASSSDDNHNHGSIFERLPRISDDSSSHLIQVAIIKL